MWFVFILYNYVFVSMCHHICILCKTLWKVTIAYILFLPVPLSSPRPPHHCFQLYWGVPFLVGPLARSMHGRMKQWVGRLWWGRGVYMSEWGMVVCGRGIKDCLEHLGREEHFVFPITFFFFFRWGSFSAANLVKDDKQNINFWK